MKGCGRRRRIVSKTTGLAQRVPPDDPVAWLFRVVRNGSIVHEGTINSLKRFTDDVREVASGYECGLHVDGFDDVHEGDIIEAYEIKEVARTQ